MVAEPGSEYVTHFNPVSGKAYDQVNELVSVATAHSGNISVLSCDGAAVNTGTAGAGSSSLFRKLRVAERVVESADQRLAIGRRFGVLFDGPAIRRSKTRGRP